jgi:hypothetical protein
VPLLAALILKRPQRIVNPDGGALAPAGFVGTLPDLALAFSRRAPRMAWQPADRLAVCRDGQRAAALWGQPLALGQVSLSFSLPTGPVSVPMTGPLGLPMLPS